MKRLLGLLGLLGIAALALWLALAGGSEVKEPALAGVEPAQASAGPAAPRPSEATDALVDHEFTSTSPGPSTVGAAKVPTRQNARRRFLQLLVPPDVQSDGTLEVQPLAGARVFCKPASEVGGDRGLPPEPALLSGAPELTIGENDRVELPDRQEAFAIFAEDASGRWASAWVEVDAEELTDVTLRYRMDLRVRVVGEDGQPRGGVGLTLRTNERFHKEGRARGETDSAGEARLRSEPLHAEDWQQVFSVMLDGAWWPQVEQVLLVGQLPGETLQLVQPEGARVEVTVLGESGQPSLGASVALVPVPAFDAAYSRIAWDVPGGERRETEEGRATFHTVTPGSDLVAVAFPPDHGDRLDQRFVAPGPGETLRLTLAFESGGVVWSGRVDPTLEGSWRYVIFDPNPNGAGWANPKSLRTEPDGSFRIRLSGSRVEAASDEALFLLGLGNDLRASVPLGPRRSEGTHDLGELDVSPSLFATGTVVDRGGEPHGEVHLRLEARSLDGGNFQYVTLAPRVKTDPEGHFTFPGRMHPSLEWRLTPNDDDAELVEPTSILPGSEGVLIVLDKASVARGRLLLPDEFADRGDLWTLFRVLVQDEKKRRSSFVHLAEDHSFEIADPPHPNYQVTVGVGWHDRPIVEVTGLDVPIGGDQEDPRLVIDLREVVHIVELGVVDAEGLVIPNAYCFPQGGKATRWGLNGRSVGSLELVFDRPFMDLLVGAPGYLEQPVTDVGEDREVQLTPAPEVTLEWIDMPELAVNQRVRPILVPEGREAKTNFASKYSFSGEGRALLAPSGVGRFEVHLQLEVVEEGMRSATLFDDDDPPVVEVQGAGRQVFRVEWPKDAVLETLAGLM